MTVNYKGQECFFHTANPFFLERAGIFRCNTNETVLKSEQDRQKCVDVLHRSGNKLSWYNFRNEMPRIKGHMMISTCQYPYPEFERNCLTPHPNDLVGQIPVEGSKNQTYRNRYCALCNGNPLNTIINWRYEFICPFKDYESNKTKEKLSLNSCKCGHKSSCMVEDEMYPQGNCTWYYAPPKGHSKNHTICSPVETCPRTPSINMTASEYCELGLKCQAYMRIVYYNETYFKNFHCAICHGVRPAQLQNAPMIASFPTLSVFFEILVAACGSNCTEIKTKPLPGERYLTFAGFVASMLSLVFLLIVYFLLKRLRTRPGKIVMGLSISLLAYQTMLFVGESLTRSAAACSIVAIFLHWAILSAFAWMTVISYDVWTTFGARST